ncbi:DNA translocase FtsK [Moraxella sp.]|uniref:DNA translocase FtsK n=1 Tax=Moraxella sp. TaxID=479 RepID=UPI00262DAE53|nr:DNA translocase FtsK 4TM domain-containing protein [Moraxella sp.]MCP3897577.1 DNA translocase FtsK [Moraxella sp.]
MNQLLQHESVNQFLGKLPIIKRLFFSVIGVGLLAFLFISLLSYNPADPAWSHVGSSSDISNVGGRLGAWVADILRAFFGLGAWFFVVVLAYELVHLWWTRGSVMWVLRLIAYVFLLACISAMFAQLGAWWQADSAANFGGMLGYELLGSLTGVLGVPVAMAFLVLMTLLVATLTFEVRWSLLWAKFAKRKTTTDDDIYTDESDEVSGADVSEDDELIISQITPRTPVYQAHNHQGTLESFLVNSGLREELIAKKQADAEAEKLAQQQAQAVPLHEEHTQPDYEEMDAPDDVMGDGNHDSATYAYEQTHQDDSVEIDTAYDVNAYDEPAHETAQQSGEYVIDEQIRHDDYLDSHQETADVHQQAPIISTERTSDENNAFGGVDFAGLSNDALIEQADEQAEHDWQMHDQPEALSNDSYASHAAHQDEVIYAEAEEIDEEETLPVDHLPKSMPSGTERPKSHAMSTLEYRMSLSAVPELDILDPKPATTITYTPEELDQLSALLEIKLLEFNVKAEVVSAMVGPVVTRFEVDLAAGIKASRVSKIAQDLARSMSMASLRVIPVIAGKPYIGIEVPNRKRQIVSLIELLDTPDYKDPNAGISIAIGTNISGKPVIADLAKAPHMLVAGTTGSGKSVLVNSFLMSMLLKYTPDELKLVLIDPKQLELANYADIPHLLTPVITDMTEATAALNWCVTEMERRYLLMSKLRVRNLAAFNQKVLEAQASGEPIIDPLWSASDHVSDIVPKLKPLSKIVVVADEFADMIMQLGKTAEEPIVRLAQKSRAAGIHLILATQRPVANVVTGLIKSNIPSRVALRVNSATDSRIIIEESGAENMLGHGDMMFLAPGAIETERVHGAYVKDDEVNRVTDAWRERGVPDYIDLTDSFTFEGEGSGDSGTGSDDEYFDLAVSHTLETRKVSISALQRKFSIGYNRAARIVDMMEERGVVSAADNSGKRQILM